MNNESIEAIVALGAMGCFITWREIIPMIQRWRLARVSRAAPLHQEHSALLAGHIKVVEELARQVTLLREVIASFAAVISPGTRQPDGKWDVADPLKTTFQVPDEELATRAGEVFARMLSENLTAEQAENEARAAEEKKTMISAVTLGPMEGERLT